VPARRPCRTRRVPCRHASSSAHDAGEHQRALAAPPRQFHAASLCAPCPSTDDEGPFAWLATARPQPSQPQKNCVRVRSLVASGTCFSPSLSSFSVCCLSWARILCKICLLASTRNILRPPPPAQRQQEYSAPHIQKRRHHPSSCSGYLPLLRALAIPGHIEAIEEPSPLVASLIGSMQPTWVLGGQLDQAFSFT
jgi:hypothetical protein